MNVHMQIIKLIIISTITFNKLFTRRKSVIHKARQLFCMHLVIYL